MKTDPVLTQLAALKAASIAEIKAQWRDLFCEEPGRVRQRGVIWSVALGHRQAALAVMCRG